MSGNQHCLILTQPDGAVKHYLLGEGAITIGRSDRNSIVLDWDTVSGNHCELHRTDKGVEIRDLNSTNGTEFNGKKLGEKSRLVTENDSLVIGLKVKARVVVLEEVREIEKEKPKASGATTQRLVDPKLPPMPSINPVAAAVAKAAKERKGA